MAELNVLLPKIGVITEGIRTLRIATDAQPYFQVGLVPTLAAAVEALKADEAVRVVVVEGGRRYFSAGASRDGLLAVDTAGAAPSYAAEVPRILLSLPVPTIAVMEGHAVGGGFVLGLWCDIVVLAEESLYGANFMALGFTPGMGATALLEEVLGGPLARELLFTGRLVTGRELKAMSGMLTHAILPRAEVRARAVAIAYEVEKVPREALMLLKQTLAARRHECLERAVKLEQAMHAELFAQDKTRLRIAERYPMPVGSEEGVL